MGNRGPTESSPTVTRDRFESDYEWLVRNPYRQKRILGDRFGSDYKWLSRNAYQGMHMSGDRFGSDYVWLSRCANSWENKTSRYSWRKYGARTRPRGTDELTVKGFFSASDPDSIFSDLAEKYNDAPTFVRMNVDEMAKFGVQTTPTFILEQHGQEVDRLVGGDWKELESRIEKLILMKLRSLYTQNPLDPIPKFNLGRMYI